MKLINELLIIESLNDYKNNVIWEKEDSIRLDGIGTIYHNGNETFPQFYKYSAPYDGHFCAEYFQVDEQEAYEIIENYIEKRKREINSLLDIYCKDNVHGNSIEYELMHSTQSEIIRCQYCKYACIDPERESDEIYCSENDFYRWDDWFCGSAKRREDV